MTDQDINNFTSSSPHRLPTLSATQALKNISSIPQRPISTHLQYLDRLLQGWDNDPGSQKNLSSGISRAEVTEIVGPPGVGKTSLALQTAVNALASGDSVIWVDTSYVLNGPRLKEFLSIACGNKAAKAEATGEERALKGLQHFTAPTLPHLFALLTHLSETLPTTKPGLFVVDNVSALFNLAFPRSSEKTNDKKAPPKKSQVAQAASSRRWAVMDKLISDLGRLAVTKNMAVILISQMTTRIRDEARAVLYPTIVGNAWESGIATRIVLYRDWLFKSSATSSQGKNLPRARFAVVTKAKNVFSEGMGRLTTFRIENNRLDEETIDVADMKPHTPPIPPSTILKRRHGEIADSESEDGDAASDHDFGWDDEAALEAGGLIG